jgi:branched-chain amino acid transport system permease protein
MIYFAIATICFNVIVTLVIERWTSLTGGPIGLSGIPEPSPIPLPFRAQISFESLTAKYYLVLLFLVLTIIITYRLVKSLTGRTFISIRDDEAGARDEELAPAIGINTLNSKLLSFAISGFFAGLSGCLYAVYFGHLTPHISNYLVTFDFLTYCVIGGIGTMLGPLVGVITLVTASELMYTLSSYRLVIFGVLLIVFMVFIPRGIVGEIEARWSRIIKRVKGG